MHDSRNRTALQELADLGPDPGPPRWHWATARLEPSGRLLLRVEARLALGAKPGESVEARCVCHRSALVLRADGGGRRIAVDRRCRAYLPAWLRRGRTTRLVVGVHVANRVVVVGPPSLLDALGDELVGGTP